MYVHTVCWKNFPCRSTVRKLSKDGKRGKKSRLADSWAGRVNFPFSFLKHMHAAGLFHNLSTVKLMLKVSKSIWWVRSVIRDSEKRIIPDVGTPPFLYYYSMIISHMTCINFSFLLFVSYLQKDYYIFSWVDAIIVILRNFYYYSHSVVYGKGVCWIWFRHMCGDVGLASLPARLVIILN